MKALQKMQDAPRRVTRISHTDRGGYIAGLDGLRALAVLSVIGYHILPGVVRGGFLGVDIFFVLSGFLISTLLIRELRKNGKISLGAFWLRRARRLLPALVALILIVVPAAWIVQRDLLVGIGRQVLGALTFSTNWLEIAHGSSYFDTTTPILFKNFWSLAIEEQFYLFWPILFIIALALIPRLSARLAAVAALALVSASFMAILYHPENITRVYYGTDTHLFGLAIGILLAFLWTDRSSTIFAQQTWVTFGKYYGIAALGMIVCAIFLLPDDTAFTYRGGIFLISCCTVVLIAAMLQPRSLLAKAGELSVLRWLGTRSYGLYLWHWPVLVIAGAAFPTVVNSAGYWIRTIFALAITFGICEVSFRFIETPIRKFGFKDSAQKLAAALRETRAAKVGAAILALLLIATITGIIAAPEKSQTQLAIEAAEKTAQKTAETKHPSTQKRTSENAAGTSENDSAKDLATQKQEIIAQNSEKITNPQVLSAKLDTSEPANTEITVIGDSMFSAAKTGLDWAMPGVKFLGKSNRQWKDASDVVIEGYQDGMVGRAVVLGFGTNAGVNDPAVVEEVIAQLGANRIILLMNLYSPSQFVDSSNQILREVADKYVNVEIVDWNALVRDNPQLLQVDQTHPSIEGANAMGKLIRSRVTEFAAELAAKK